MVILGTTGMRASVTAAWPAMCRRYEGVTTWMYADTKGLVTTGIGFLIDSATAAQALPWKTKAGTLATAGQVATEWQRVKSKTSWTKYSGLNAVWKDSAVLFLDLAVVDAKLLETTQKFWARLRTAIPLLDSFPADAQLALMDESWQNGPGFLDATSAWTGTRAAVLAQDWVKAASHVPGDVNSPRAIARRRLFTNAAAVVRLGLDPDVLWDTTTPTTPPPPVTPTPPTEPPVMHSDRWNSDYVSFRGGYVPPVVRDILLAIPSPVTLSQGGLSSAVAASANTHVGLGAYDIKVSGWSKDAILKLCSELISCGECAFPRGPRWGSASFSEHVHVCSNNAYASLHPDAQAQVRDFKHSPRLNGLVGHARYVGPSTPLGKWSDSPWNPVNIAIKENELPTTAEVAKALATNQDFLNAVAKAVLDYDYVPNAGALTSNVDNENVATKTALTQLGKKSNDIAAKLDALIARFPEPVIPPPAA